MTLKYLLRVLFSSFFKNITYEIYIYIYIYIKFIYNIYKIIKGNDLLDVFHYKSLCNL